MDIELIIDQKIEKEKVVIYAKQNTEKITDIINKKANKKIYPVLMGTFIITFLAIYSKNVGDIIGVLVSFVWSGFVILKISIEILLNKYSIKQINEKLKEIYKK